ncbi:MAG: DUF952 domain-containing protein [Deltaproteobacteria bacterium]|nr:DUF952 domain-containing protein [Deltaproteobacteria bacterium]
MILHIVKRDEWENAIRNKAYAPSSLENEGFIHCSTAAQVVETANLFYRGQSDLMIVCLDEGRLTSQLTYEPALRVSDERAGTLFPHIYGPLNLEAISEVYEFPCDAEGRFVLPSALSVA